MAVNVTAGHIIYEPFEFLEAMPALSIITVVVLVLSAVLGTFGNILILVAVGTQQDLQNVESIFVVNLACCDLYVTSVADALSIVGKILGWRFFDRFPMLCKAVGSLCTVSCVGSLLTLAAMSLSRYVLICHHSYYPRIFNTRNSILMCCAFLTVGFTLISLNFYGVGDHSFDHKSLECIWDRMANHDYTTFFAVAMVLMPIVLTGLAYLRLYLHVRKSRAKIHNHTNGDFRSRQNASFSAAPSETPGKESSVYSRRNVVNKSERVRLRHVSETVPECEGQGTSPLTLTTTGASPLQDSVNSENAAPLPLNVRSPANEAGVPTLSAVIADDTPTETADRQAQTTEHGTHDYRANVTEGSIRTIDGSSTKHISHNELQTREPRVNYDKDPFGGELSDLQHQESNGKQPQYQHRQQEKRVFMIPLTKRERSTGAGAGRGAGATSGKRAARRSMLKLARTLFIIYVVFSACWLPFALLLALDSDDTASHELHVTLVVWAHLHPSINWLVYFHTNSKFNAAFRKLLGLNSCCS